MKITLRIGWQVKNTVYVFPHSSMVNSLTYLQVLDSVQSSVDQTCWPIKTAVDGQLRQDIKEFNAN